MTTATTVTWNPLNSQAAISEIVQKAAEMQSQGKTDNVPNETFPDGEGNPPLIAVRQWTTLADAQEWIDFLAPYNPQSAVINT
jgi:hypothetical protein